MTNTHGQAPAHAHTGGRTRRTRTHRAHTHQQYTFAQPEHGPSPKTRKPNRQPQVKASDARCAELSQELAVTREELARASAVAARVAASEAKAGIKVEGTVTMAQHGGCGGRPCFA